MTALPAVILLRHRYKNKTSWEFKYRKLSLSLVLLLFFGTAMVLYGSFIEPHRLVVKQESIDLPGINKPIKIALVADIQVGPYRDGDYVAKFSKLILKQKPDIVLMAGDHINNSGNDTDELSLLKNLQILTKQLPVYAVQGNHEYGISDGASFFDDNYRLPDLSESTKKYMEGLGVNFLSNDKKLIKINDQEFYLFGGDSYWAQKLDLSQLRNKEKDIPTIALIHNPAAIFDVSGYDVDLFLAGHTHGGQIRLPFIGPLIPVDRVLPRSWHQGWVDYKEIKMYVTSGVGETGVRARLLTPPEIVVLTVY